MSRDALTQRCRDAESGVATQVRLGDVCELNMGQSPESASYNTVTEGLPFYQGNADFGPIYPTPRVWCNSPVKIAEAGDLLVSVRAPIGALNFANERCCIGRGLAALRVKPDSDSKFIYYALKSNVTELNARGTGSTFKAINKKALSNLLFPLPPLAAQRRIAAKLDRLCDIIAKRKQQLVQLQQLVKSRFVEMFGDVTSNPMGWIKERLESHIDVLAGYPFDSSQYVEGDGIKICGGLIIMPGWIDWSQCKKWRSTREVEQYLLNDGDIVMALDRPWISTGFKVAQIRREELPALLIQRTARIRGVDIDQSFLLYLLKDHAFECHCTVTGSLVPHISHKDIRSYEVIVPPLVLQREFAAFVAKVDKLAFAARQRRDVAKQLYRAKIQEFFG